MDLLRAEGGNRFRVETARERVNGDGLAAAGTTARNGVRGPGHRLHRAERGGGPVQGPATIGITNDQVHMRVQAVGMDDGDVGTAGREFARELASHLLQPFVPVAAQKWVIAILQRNHRMTCGLALAVVLQQKRARIDGGLPQHDAVDVGRRNGHDAIDARQFVAVARVGSHAMGEQAPDVPGRLDRGDGFGLHHRRRLNGILSRSMKSSTLVTRRASKLPPRYV
jgi:hypothetical protein